MGKNGEGVWRWGKREIIYLSLHCHYQDDSCIEMGSDESHFNVSLIVRDKITRQRLQTTTFMKRKESRSAIQPRSLCLPVYDALPLGQTDSNLKTVFIDSTVTHVQGTRSYNQGGTESELCGCVNALKRTSRVLACTVVDSTRGSLYSTDFLKVVDVEVLIYVHRNRRLIRDGSPGRPPRLSHSS